MLIVETCPECGGDLMSLVLTSYPPISAKSCRNCGWYWEGKPEEIVRVSFKDNKGAQE